VQLFRHACFAAAAAGEIVWRDIDGALASRQGNDSCSLFARVVPLCHFPRILQAHYLCMPSLASLSTKVIE
jgi:hypothetical protein